MGWQVPKFDQLPSGELTLVITNVHGLRQRWSESGDPRPESVLNRFLGWPGLRSA